MEDFIETFSLSNNPFVDLRKYLQRYQSVKFLFDDFGVKNEISQNCGDAGFNVTLQFLEDVSKQYLDNLAFSGEDVVVACGAGNICDCGKYYAASYSVPIICVFLEDFFDFNVSKFALIFDGVSNEFYSAISPIAFFIKQREGSLEMEAYARAKSVDYFDFKFNEILLQNTFNDDAKQFLKNTIMELRLENYSYTSIVKAFIRIGMAMTFFDSTKLFLFGYFDLFNFLTIMKDKRRCQTSLSLISKTYMVSFKYNISVRGINLNSLVNRMSRILCVPSFCVLKSLKPISKTISSKNNLIKLNAYREYLKELLLRNLVSVKDYKIEKEYIQSLNYATFFSTRCSLLKFLNECGIIRV